MNIFLSKIIDLKISLEIPQLYHFLMLKIFLLIDSLESIVYFSLFFPDEVAKFLFVELYSLSALAYLSPSLLEVSLLLAVISLHLSQALIGSLHQSPHLKQPVVQRSELMGKSFQHLHLVFSRVFSISDSF